MSQKNNILTSAQGYSTAKLTFSAPVEGKVPNSPIKFHRIYVSTQNPDGTTGDLIMPTEECFTFGVSENKSQETEEVTGYTLPLILYNKSKDSPVATPTPEQKAFVKTIESIVEACKKHLLSAETKKLLKRPDLDASDLKKFNPLSYRKNKETGELMKELGPTLYPKLMESKKTKKFFSIFRLVNEDREVEPLELLGKMGKARCAVKIESIFVGAKIALQIKLYEAHVQIIESMVHSILPKMVPSETVQEGDIDTHMNELDIHEEGSIHEEEQPKPETPPPVVEKKKTVKKVVPKPKA